MSFPLTADTVREFLTLDVDATSRYTDTTIGSNIRTATAILERKTGRRLTDVNATYRFTTEGRTSLIIPGLRSASVISLNGAVLLADSTYFLQPDVQQTGVYTGLAFTGYGSRDYHAVPDWFGRGLDFGLDAYRYRSGYSLPNDLSISGDWGYVTMPDEVLMAVKLLAAHFTKLADANSSGVLTTGSGNTFDVSGWPEDVVAFVNDWSLLAGLASVSM